METTKATGLSPMPDSAPAATLSAGTPARVIDRSGEWVRVQLDGWVRESDVKPAEAGVLAGITAAQVRATPDRFVGQTLDWRLQIIAVQVADELRPEMRPGTALPADPRPAAGARLRLCDDSRRSESTSSGRSHPCRRWCCESP